MNEDQVEREVTRVYECVRMATASEDLALRGVERTWWTAERNLSGLAARREVHVVHAIASFLRQVGYATIIDDGSEAGHRDEGCANRCDLAVRLPLQEPRWLWLEVSVVLEQAGKVSLEDARADLVKMRQVSSAQWNKRLQGLVVVGFGAHEPGATPPLKLVLAQFAEEQWIDQWPLARIAARPVDSGSGSIKSCVLGMWVRTDRQAK